MTVAAAPAGWGERTACLAIFLANGVGIGAWAGSLAAFKLKLGISDGALSLVLLAFAGGAVLAMPLTGILTPRFGTGAVTRVCALGFAVTLLLPPLADSLPALTAAAFLVGAGSGTLDVSMNAYASEVEQRWGAAIMSSFHAAFSAGGLAGAGLALLLAGDSGTATLTPAIAAVIAFGLAAAAWTRLGPGLRAAADGPAFMVPGRAALILCAAALIGMMCEGAAADWSAVFLATVTGAGAGFAAAGYAAFAAAMFGGRILGDAAVRRLGPVQVVAVGGGCGALGLLLAAAVATPWAAAAGFALLGLGLSNVVPVVFSAAGRRGATPAAGVAMAATAGYAGFLLGPPLIGGIAELAGLRLAIGLLAGLAAMLALLAPSARA